MQSFRLRDRIVDLHAGLVRVGTATEALTPIEVRLLEHLSRRSGETVPREELLTEVWGYHPNVRSRTLDTTLRRVRAKLEPDPSNPEFLHSIYGRGIRLDRVEPIRAESSVFATRFVGRREMLASLASAVRDSRLVTVWGPGGAGKSRLLGEVAPRIGPGCVFVGCGGARSGQDLDCAVAEALGVDPRAAVGRVLARVPTVLVLDGCESAAELVSERVVAWLAGAPGLRVLASSRSELCVPGEQLFPVGPLGVEEAIELFLDRARLRDPGFDAAPERIARLVSRVDRLPLAVEIAASQVHLVGLERLESLLDAPLEVFGERSAMGEVIERSIALLAPQERRILAAASVFEAPFDLDDLAAVTDLPLGRALSHLEALVRPSLVFERDGHHQLYALVRDRARRELPPDDPVHQRHARWFGRLGAPEAVERCRAEPEARAELWRRTPDLRAALERTLPSEPELALPCGLALLWRHAREGRLAEGTALVRRLDGLPGPARARVLLGSLTATLCSASGDERGALEALQRVFPLLSEPSDHVHVRCAAAISRGRLGDPEGVERELEAAAPLAPAASNHAEFLGTRAIYGPPAELEARMREALGVARARGNPGAEVECLGVLASLAHLHHADWSEGRRSFGRLLALCGSDETMVRTRARAYVGLGVLERSVGDLDAAEGCFEQAATLGARHGIEAIVRSARVELARAWNQAGRHEDALGLVEPLTLVEPSHGPAARALLALAEVRERLGEGAAARRLLERLIAQSGGAKIDAVADAHDLLALISGDEQHLALAAAFDERLVTAVRRRALASLLARARGEIARAEAERAEAEAGIARLGLLPGSEPALWLARSPG